MQLLSTNVHQATFKQLLSTKIVCEVRSHSTCAEQLAQSHLRRATCAERLHKAFAQSNLHRPTCTEHMRKALARSNWRRALAQSNFLRALAQTNLHRAHAQSACAEQLAQSTSTCAEHEHLRRATCTEHLRAAACSSLQRATCAQQPENHFREKSRGAVREESRMMRRSSHVTIHTEHRRAQTRSPQR